MGHRGQQLGGMQGQKGGASSRQSHPCLPHTHPISSAPSIPACSKIHPFYNKIPSFFPCRLQFNLHPPRPLFPPCLPPSPSSTLTTPPSIPTCLQTHPHPPHSPKLTSPLTAAPPLYQTTPTPKPTPSQPLHAPNPPPTPSQSTVSSPPPNPAPVPSQPRPPSLTTSRSGSAWPPPAARTLGNRTPQHYPRNARRGRGWCLAG